MNDDLSPEQMTRTEQRLRRELEECRRGVAHLYAELDRNAEQLRRLADGRGRFLSSMTHEFRTPLGSILTLSRMLLEESEQDMALGDEQVRQVTFIKKAAETLSELMNDLIDLSRLDAGRAPINVRRFRVTDLFGGLMGQLRPMLRSDRVTLVFEEPPGDPYLETDETKLAQILRNLLSNALKYTDAGEVRVRALRNDDGTLTVNVSDTGVGIALADQERIFEEFIQVEGPHQRRVKGSGLGLPISRRLAQVLGGRLELRSALGRGATFSLTLPVVHPGQASERLEMTHSRGGASVVVVSRSREAVARYEQAAHRAGFVPHPAQDTPLGRQLVAVHQPRALVVELDAGDLSLWQLVDEVSAAAELPVLVVGPESARERAVLARASFHERSAAAASVRRALGELGEPPTRPRVLLIDDDESHRYLMGRLLALLQVDVIDAATGEQGLRAAREQGPAAIMLDLGLPDLDGVEVLRRLRAEPQTQHLKIIVHTGQSLGPEELAELTGAHVVMAKESRSHQAQLVALREALQSVGVAVREPLESAA